MREPVAIDTSFTTMAEAMSAERRQRVVARTVSQREGTAKEVAALIAFLLLDRTEYMTGSVLSIDGGLTL
jgi:3-oxoacyl-[acyl-carrier protein] reductase